MIKGVKPIKSLEKNNIRGHIELCVLSNYDFSYLTNNMKPLSILGNYCHDGETEIQKGQHIFNKTDIFVFCKNEKTIIVIDLIM